MHQKAIYLVFVLLILKEVYSKNSTKASSSSNPLAGTSNKKNSNRLPNRQGSWTRDPIFGELLNKKGGPPRKKRVRTTYNTYPDLEAHSTVDAKPFMHSFLYSNPVFHGYSNQLRTIPFSPQHIQPQTIQRPVLGNAFIPRPYLSPHLTSSSVYPSTYTEARHILSPTRWPTIYLRKPLAVTPYYLFSKCAGLSEFPQTLSKLAAQFSVLDTDHNGLLSQTEWENDIIQQLESTKSGVNKLFVQSVFRLVDKDSNSAMDFTELLEATDVGGVNNDGMISRLEFEMFWLKAQLSGARPFLESDSVTTTGATNLNVMLLAFNLLDEDEDNLFTYTEFLQLDLDRDGEVGSLEFYYFLYRVSYDKKVHTDNVGKLRDKGETDYVSVWLKEANRLPLKMLKVSFTKFDQADIDFNGALDSLEYLRLKESVIIAYAQESHKLLFELNDMNDDGFITVEEQEALAALGKSQVDEESDLVKFGEFRKKEYNKNEFPRLILNSDTNGDGKISKEEYIAQTEASITCRISENNIQLISDILSFDMAISL